MKVKPSKQSGQVVVEVNDGDEALLASEPSPFRVRKILVPVDFSDCSKKALQYAVPFAKQHGASLTLLYVVPTPMYTEGQYGVDYATFEADMRAGGVKELDTLVAREIDGAVPTETVVSAGSAAIEIVELAKRMPADLVVISTHGRTGFKHVFLGSVAERVVQQAPCPVLVVREREREFAQG